MGIGKLFAGFGSDKKYQTMGPDELLKLDNVELRDAISARLMKEAGRMEVPQVIASFTGAKRTFYIVSLYETELATDGLCRFLVGQARSAAPYILDALKEIHASRHADLLRKFTAVNGINLNDLSNMAIESSWDYDDRRKMYPFDDFNRQFEQLYDKESIDTRLIQYVRNNIDKF